MPNTDNPINDQITILTNRRTRLRELIMTRSLELQSAKAVKTAAIDAYNCAHTDHERAVKAFHHIDEELAELDGRLKIIIKKTPKESVISTELKKLHAALQDLPEDQRNGILDAIKAKHNTP